MFNSLNIRSVVDRGAGLPDLPVESVLESSSDGSWSMISCAIFRSRSPRWISAFSVLPLHTGHVLFFWAHGMMQVLQNTCLHDVATTIDSMSFICSRHIAHESLRCFASIHETIDISGAGLEWIPPFKNIIISSASIVLGPSVIPSLTRSLSNDEAHSSAYNRWICLSDG